MLEMNSELRELAFKRATTAELRRGAKASGMRALVEDGKMKIFKGTTTPEEVSRITQTEDVVVD